MKIIYDDFTVEEIFYQADGLMVARTKEGISIPANRMEHPSKGIWDEDLVRGVFGGSITHKADGLIFEASK